MEDLIKDVLEKSASHGLPYVAFAIFSILSGVFGAWFKSRADLKAADRSADRSDFQTIVEERRKEKEEMVRERAALQAEMHEMSQTIDLMKGRVIALEGRVAQRPFPEWSLDAQGRYSWVNRDMVARFLPGRNQDWILGKKPSDVWSQNVTALFDKLDEEVRGGHPHMTVIAGVSLAKGEPPFIVVKYGQSDVSTGEVIQYYGMAIPMSPIYRDEARLAAVAQAAAAMLDPTNSIEPNTVCEECGKYETCPGPDAINCKKGKSG